MKHFAITILLLYAASVNLFAQNNVDPCYILIDVMNEVDIAVVNGKYEEALRMLEKLKNNPEMKNCDKMKDGVVDFRINEVKKKIEEKNKQLQQVAMPTLLPSYKKCPDNKHPHLIDLGLPSGTKWACCNVGATTPEGLGGRYAWGETEEKEDYTWETYKFCDGTKEGCYDNGSSISGTKYDVAYVKWGNPWQMPSSQQVSELINSCKSKNASVNGVRGRKFISKFNGAFVFLPAVNYPEIGPRGSYWIGDHTFSSHNYYNSCLFFGRTFIGRYKTYLCEGCYVRPIIIISGDH